MEYQNAFGDRYLGQVKYYEKSSFQNGGCAKGSG